MIKQEIIFDYNIDMLDEMIENIRTHDDVSVIVDSLNHEYIMDTLTEDDYDELDCDENICDGLIMIDKFFNCNGDVVLMVTNLEQDTGEISSIMSDLIIVERDMFDAYNLHEKVNASDKLILMDYKEYIDIFDDNEFEDENEDALDDFLEDKLQEFVEIVGTNKDNVNFCLSCFIKDYLNYIYDVGYKHGKNDLAIALSDVMNDMSQK